MAHPARLSIPDRRPDIMTLPIDGPRIEPRSGVARKLVVILHGYGADGNDLIGLGHEWADFLPDTAFVAPNAHEACAHMPSGRQWFALTDRNPHERWSGACAAAPVINAFIDAELQARGLNNHARRFDHHRPVIVSNTSRPHRCADRQPGHA